MSLRSDMAFFFQNNLFVRSNFFSTMLGSSYVSLHQFQNIATYNEPYTDNDFRQIKKFGKIQTKYHQLPIIHRRQLDALFNTEYQWPAEFRLAGKHAGLMCWATKQHSLPDAIKYLQNRSNREAAVRLATKMYQDLENIWSNTR
jgi:hypothetical protein